MGALVPSSSPSTWSTTLRWWWEAITSTPSLQRSTSSLVTMISNKYCLLSNLYFQLWLSISTLSTFSFSSSDWSVLQRAAKSTLLSMSILSQPSCLLRIFWPTLFNVQWKRVQDRIVYILRYFFYPFPHLWCCFEYASVGIRRAIYDLSLYIWGSYVILPPLYSNLFFVKNKRSMQWF